MKVLWVTPYLPSPSAGGGPAHEWELLRHAARRHDIEVITTESVADTQIELDGSSVPMQSVSWKRPDASVPSRLRYAIEVLRAWPTHELRTGRARLDAARAGIAAAQRRQPRELVHITSTELAPVADACDAPTALLAFDVIRRQAARERALASSFAEVVRWTLDERRAAIWERRWLRRVTGVAAVSSVDAAELSTMVSREVPVVPNPISDAFFAPPSVPRSTRTAVFVGNLAYRPNIDAAHWLMEDIWPAVRQLLPDAVLELVGHRPHPSLVETAARTGTTLHADVPDVRPHYWGAAVTVAPVRLGSGLRNKIIHAMACDAPVVATTASIEGIDVRPGVELLVADDADAFAAAVVETLTDTRATAERVDRARSVLAPYRSGAVAEAFDAWWTSVARAGQSTNVR